MARKAAEQKQTFEERMLALETLIGDMESGRMGLEEALKAYEQGSEMLTALEKELEDAKRRVTVLRTDENGNDVEEPFTPKEDE